MKGRAWNKDQWQMQSMIIPSIIFLAVFAYIPMYGVIIAFKDYNILSTMTSSEWVGLKYFKEFLNDPTLFNTLKNTVMINGLGLLLAFPAPILLALILNELYSNKLKKIAQTVSYLPHFLSWVIFGGIMLEVLAPGGVLSDMFQLIGMADEPINFMAKGNYFYIIFTILNIIKNVGFGSIIYVAAISGVDQQLYEAATVDGCNRFQKICYITLPCIIGTIIIMFIFQISAILNTGYEQIILLQNPLNLQFSETIDTYVYKVGIKQSRMSYATAVGILKSIISVGLMLMANKLSKKCVGKGLF
nr:ABC transporter permease subunit [uncultured Niameybacter sp.]